MTTGGSGEPEEVPEFDFDGMTYAVTNRDEDACVLVQARRALTGKVVVPDSVAGLNSEFFVTGISIGAFSDQRQVTELTFGRDSQVVSFDFWSFQNMTSLKVLEFPQLLQKVHPEAFRDTPNLERIIVKSGSFVEEGGCVYSKDKSCLYFVPRNKEGVVRLDPKVVRLGGCALEGCTKVTGLENTAQLQVIACSALAGTKIKRFTIGKDCFSIGEGAFRDCDQLETVAFEAECQWENVPEKCFAGCTSLRELIFPASVKRLKSRCLERTYSLAKVGFANNSQLEEIESEVLWSSGVRELKLPGSLKKFGSNNFFACDNLVTIEVSKDSCLLWDPPSKTSAGALYNKAKSILYFVQRNCSDFKLPDEVVEISGFAMYHCSGLKVFSCGNRSQLKKIGNSAFAGSGLESFSCPSSVQEIHDDAFANCYSLKAMLFADGNLKSIGRGAFGFAALPACILPDSVETVGEFAFSQSSVKCVVLGASVRRISDYMFYGCKKLETVVAKASDALEISAQAFCEAGNVKVKTSLDIKLEPSCKNAEVTVMKAENLDNEIPVVGLPARKPQFQTFQNFVDAKLKEGYQKRNALYKSVHLYVLTQTGRVCVGKELVYVTADEKDRANKEISCSMRLYHPAIVGCLGVDQNDTTSTATVFIEYYEHGSLDKYIFDETKRKDLTPTAIAKIAVGTAYGLGYLHKCNSFHRDVKPENLLLDDNWEVKISDFGSVKIQEAIRTGVTENVFTYLYRAPETHNTTEYTNAVDIFAYGIVLWELLAGQRAYEVWKQQKKLRGPPEVLAQRFFDDVADRSWRPPMDRIEPKWVLDLIERCTDSAPTQRPTFEAIGNYLSEHNYQFLPGVDVREVEDYVARLVESEKRCPPFNMPAGLLDRVKPK